MRPVSAQVRFLYVRRVRCSSGSIISHPFAHCNICSISFYIFSEAAAKTTVKSHQKQRKKSRFNGEKVKTKLQKSIKKFK